METAHRHSDYWLLQDGTAPDLERLVTRLRAVSNFVRILTGNTDIDVIYSDGNDSRTDGKTIILSTANENPDVTVGLALHEASHILYSNFEFIQSIQQASDDVRRAMHGNFKDTYPSIIPMQYTARMESCQLTPITALHYLMIILNIIEDRRIDANTYEAAPGYRPYYDALYQEFLYGRKEINDKLASGYYAAEQTLESYIEYLIHIANPILDIDSLVGFRDIVTLIDLENIQRFNKDPHMKSWKATRSEISIKTIPNIWKLCLDIFDIILQHAKIINIPYEETVFAEVGIPSRTDISDDQREERKFIMGKVEKETCSPNVKSAIDNTILADAEFLQIKGEGHYPTKVTVFNRLHNNMSCLKRPQGSDSDLWHSGLAMGRKLLHSLRIRIYDDRTTLPRYKSGRIDSRLLAQAGIGIETVFNRFVDAPHRPVLIHYTIDASSSMNGIKFHNAIRLAIALAFVSKNLRNFHFVASMRNSPSRMVNVYKLFDSNIDNLPYAKKFMPRLITSGGTPEGLGIYPMLSGMVSSKETRKILVNISDGMPSGGTEKTAVIMREFRNAGIDIIGYYVSSGENDVHVMRDFRSMYGADSEFIDVEDFHQIAKTVNKRLLEK